MFDMQIFIIALISFTISNANETCVTTSSCYDAEDVKAIHANPFFQEYDQASSSSKGQASTSDNSKKLDTSETSNQHESKGTQPTCANMDICQLMCLQNLMTVKTPLVSTNNRGSPGRRGPPGAPGPPGYPMGIVPVVLPIQFPSAVQGLNQSKQTCKIPEVIKGLKGDPGLKGDQGLPGREGLNGITGEKGPMGPKGDRGVKGEPAERAGPPGPYGSPGHAGINGDKGEKGSTGPPADRVYGLPGPPGVPGYKGRNGDRGAAGALMLFMPSAHNFTADEMQVLGNYEDLSFILPQKLDRNGQRSSPGRTCLDIKTNYFKRNREFESGKYWIDPNGGDLSDAFEVFCNDNRIETCIEATQNRSENISYKLEGQKTFDEGIWLSQLNNGMKIDYGEIISQIGFLQLSSGTVRQEITIHCRNTVAYYNNLTNDYSKAVQLMSWNDVALNAKSGHRDLRYNITSIDECNESKSGWGKTTFEYKTDKTFRLPITDVAVFDYGVEKMFAVEIGPVCFGDLNESEDASGSEDFYDSE